MRELQGFVLVNDEKVDRALHGSMGSQGKLVGGVGDEAKDEAILAEYDKLGGLILQDGIKVKSGAFWDFAKKVARKEPLVSYEIAVDGEVIEVNKEEAKALKSAKDVVKDLKAKKIKKLK